MGVSWTPITDAKQAIDKPSVLSVVLKLQTHFDVMQATTVARGSLRRPCDVPPAVETRWKRIT